MNPFFTKKEREHIALQIYLKKLFGDACTLEKPFPEIGRIADCAHFTYKCVFEIQCSPISFKEALSRTSDYKSIGFSVVWILHDKLFNRFRFSRLEKTLRSIPHYYTNMSSNGKGFIYDQLEIFWKGFRLHRGPPLPIDLRKPIYPPFGAQRDVGRTAWPLRFQGDLLDQKAISPKKRYPVASKKEQKDSIFRFLVGLNFRK